VGARQGLGQREKALMTFLTSPRTMEEIVAQWIVHGKPREPRPFYEHGERATMGKHLERLTKEGAVTLEGTRYRRV
jgi:hypothetical protein